MKKVNAKGNCDRRKLTVEQKKTLSRQACGKSGNTRQYNGRASKPYIPKEK